MNFVTTARLNPTSRLERAADFLLRPARLIFCGKNVFVFEDNTIHIERERIRAHRCIQVILIIVACAALPFATLGGLVLKAVCFVDRDFRNFYTSPIRNACQAKISEIFEHVYSTKQFVYNRDGKLFFNPLNLYECSCRGTGAFHRIRNGRRNRLENAIVSKLSDLNPDKTQPLALLSMGSGGLLSDFMTMEKLVLAGFRNISIDCVDPEGIDEASVEGIRKFLGDLPSLTITMRAFKNIDEVPENTGYASILAVDYDNMADWDPEVRFNCTADIMKAHARLRQNGFLALGISNEDTLAGPQVVPVSFRDPSIIYKMAEDLALQLPQSKDELLIKMPSFRFAERSHFLMLALSLAVESSRKQYNKISLICFNEENHRDWIDSFKKMMIAMFPGKQIEIRFDDNRSTQCDLLFTGSLEDEFISKRYQTFVNPSTVSYMVFGSGSIDRQNGLNEKHRFAVLKIPFLTNAYNTLINVYRAFDRGF